MIAGAVVGTAAGVDVDADPDASPTVPVPGSIGAGVTFGAPVFKKVDAASALLFELRGAKFLGHQYQRVKERRHYLCPHRSGLHDDWDP